MFTAVFLVAFMPNVRQGNPVLEKILAKLSFWEKNFPQEKVYLHLDKPYYAAGDDIWFKAYLVNGPDNTPSQVSNVLYVELLNPQDSVYRRLVVDVQNGLGHGDFALEDTIPEGQYRLRAYTSWMQNFDENYFFHQDIQIWNPRVQDVAVASEFEFKKQPKGDSVLAQLSLKTLQEAPLPQTLLTYVIKTGRKTTSRRKTTTDQNGQVVIPFLASFSEMSPKTQILVTVPQKGKVAAQLTIPVPINQDKLDLAFLPEGGQMVADMWSVLGVKAVDFYGLGKNVQGEIYDQTGAKVTDFTTTRLGIGRLGFVPKKGRQYQARVKNATGAEVSYPLPAVQDRGVVMAVDNSKEEAMKVKLYLVGFRDGSTRPKAVTIIGQNAGRVYFTGHVANAKDLVLVDVPKSNFPTGVAQLTAFSNTGEPLAERLVFINRQQHLQLSLTPDKASYKPRQKVTMQVQTRDAQGNPVAGNFSVAVTDAQKVEQEQHSASILTHLLLTSDLRGNIEQPGYYFSAPTPEVTLALDNLMLTQGWRRFVWRDLWQDKFPVLSAPVERGMAITGTALRFNKKPEPFAQLSVFGVGPENFFRIDSADAQGRFAVPVAKLSDSTQVIVQARTKKGGSGLLVDLDKGLPLAPVTLQAPVLLPDALRTQQVQKFLKTNQEQFRLDQLTGKSILLNSVLIKGQKEKDQRRSGIHTYSDATVDPTVLNQDLNFFSAVSGRQRIRLTYDEWGSAQLQLSFGGNLLTPTLLINGMQVDPFTLQQIPVPAIEKIEILHPESAALVYGPKGTNGIVAVTLKPGGKGFASDTKFKGVAVYKGPRMHVAREFYSPNYEQPQKEEIADLRTTIFWSPSVQTDVEGKAEFSFYTADARTNYHVLLQGMTATGQLGLGTARQQVQ
ncbi:MG2 domain-containing protein [Rufibacter sp. LB8]|uniref:MG2 domain-containing protein n=1 Tax=Rufibacter sp. LB8 TaxID=2777781 RepID=UPI00178C3DD9|nr:MG2 domain-containing protein [Rufibacter sp. LB8]